VNCQGGCDEWVGGWVGGLKEVPTKKRHCEYCCVNLAEGGRVAGRVGGQEQGRGHGSFSEISSRM
jgi:hypothetical protein